MISTGFPIRLPLRSALLALPFALLVIWLSGGVQINSGNHAGLLPVVQRLIDPGYLPDDFGVGLRLYHHRVFAELLAAPWCGCSARLAASRC